MARTASLRTICWQAGTTLATGALMHESTAANDTPPAASAIHTRSLAITGALRPYVSALMAAELGATGPLPLAIAPHVSLVLSVQLGRGAGGIEQKGKHGENTCLTGIRRWTGAFIGAGNCVSLFALLTPLGSVHLLKSQPLHKVPRIGARVDELLDRSLTRSLESDIALADTLDAKLHAFAAWLEARATAPRHLAQVARVQAVSRKAQAGASLADIAADVGGVPPRHRRRHRVPVKAAPCRKCSRPVRAPSAQSSRRPTPTS